MVEERAKEAKGDAGTWIDIRAELRAGHALTLQPADKSAPPVDIAFYLRGKELPFGGILRRDNEICGKVVDLEGDEQPPRVTRLRVEPLPAGSEEQELPNAISIGLDGVPVEAKEELNPDAIREAEESGFRKINLDTLVYDIKKRRALHERLEREDHASPS